MKPTLLFTSILGLFVVLQGCNQSQNNKSNTDSLTTTAITGKSKSETATPDYRPESEIKFLNKVNGYYFDGSSSNSAQKDMEVVAFNKYALDSLKKISNWEFIVNNINDYSTGANTFYNAFLDKGNGIYNVELVAPFQYDKTVDTIDIIKSVDFIYTISKNPKGEALKKQLATIQRLQKGDTVVVSGSITYIDDNLKVNFAKVFDKGEPWEVDLLATSISKK